MDPVDPEGLTGQLMDTSVVAVASPINNPRHGGLSNNSLTSALASATPENQRLVCKSLFELYV